MKLEQFIDNPDHLKEFNTLVSGKEEDFDKGLLMLEDADNKKKFLEGMELAIIRYELFKKEDKSFEGLKYNIPFLQKVLATYVADSEEGANLISEAKGLLEHDLFFQIEFSIQTELAIKIGEFLVNKGYTITEQQDEQVTAGTI